MAKRLLPALLTALLVCGGAVADEPASADALKQRLAGNTLIYTDPATGLENSVYFGRFGNDFDRYVPCETSVGTWRTAAGGICLTGEEGTGPETCYSIDVSGESVAISKGGQWIRTARLEAGNRLPMG